MQSDRPAMPAAALAKTAGLEMYEGHLWAQYSNLS